jgi:amino acid transporter
VTDAGRRSPTLGTDYEAPPAANGFLKRSKRVIIGSPMETEQLKHERLGNVTALAVFASDNLSSSAYATEEILRMLIWFGAVGAVAFHYVVPITVALLAVLGVLLFSYRQTIKAYPQAGGAYLVTRDNFGVLPAQIAGTALLTDYILTVSVSVSAGTAALTSFVPSLFPWRVPISLFFIVIITWGNLRGVRESGRMFAVPTYFFIVMMFVLIGMGVVKMFTGNLHPVHTFALPAETKAITLFIILKAFASGGAAVTGVEAISNGVPAFKAPEWINARKTLMWMGCTLGAMFLGLSILAARVRAVPDPKEQVTILAQIGKAIFGTGATGHLLFGLLQVSTLLILVLAANTSFADFPRLASFHAGDRFLPRQLTRYGDRLVFSNGIMVLAGFAALLVIVFKASVTALIPLYAIGVFTSFTFSQLGMSKKHLVEKEEGWRLGLLINGFGGIVTGVMTIVIAYVKFAQGAWIILITIPVALSGLLAVSRHYKEVGKSLRHPDRRPVPGAGNHVVLLVGRPSEAERRAFLYAERINAEDLRCVHFTEPDDPRNLESMWARTLGLLPTTPSLEIVNSRGGATGKAVRAYIENLRKRIPAEDFVTVVVSASIPKRFGRVFGSRTALRIKTQLLFVRDVVVTDVPDIPDARQQIQPTGVPHDVVLLVSGVHNATLHALEYAKSLDADRINALHVSIDVHETESLVRDWDEWHPGLPLEVIHSPYRDIEGPILDFVRNLSADGRAVVTIVLPEFIVKKWWHNLLHNQTALTLKRMFVAEPNVVVTSVPYRL